MRALVGLQRGPDMLHAKLHELVSLACPQGVEHLTMLAPGSHQQHRIADGVTADAEGLDPNALPVLSIVGKAKPMLKGRKIGALVTDDADGDRVEASRTALEKEGAELAIVAPKIGGVRPKSGKPRAVDMALSAAPSVSFDAVAIFASPEGVKPLLKNSAAIDWIRNAFGHLKVIGCTAAARPLFGMAAIADDLDEGVIELDARASIPQYIEAAKRQRVWDREARLSGDDT